MTRTNPAYAFLAYRAAILEHTAAYLRDSVLGADGIDPTAHIISGDVLRDEEVVPREDVMSFIEELEEQVAKIRIEMGGFTFARIDRGEDERKKQTRGPRKKISGSRGSTGEDEPESE